jgi:hypothetical protein
MKNDFSMEYKKWLHIAGNIAGCPQGAKMAVCPHCATYHVGFQYFGDPDSRMGFLRVWCNNCLYGIVVSRVAIPPDAPMHSWRDPMPEGLVPEYFIVEPC